MSEKMKPCPFCGGLPMLFISENKHWVQCLFSDEKNALEAIRNREKNGVLLPWNGCLASTTSFDTEAEAIAAWNRRVEE